MSTSKFHDEKTKQKKYVKEEEKKCKKCLFNEMKEGCLYEREKKKVY